MGFFEKLRAGLTRTKQSIVERFDEIVRVADEPAKRSRPIDVDTVSALEELLISADIGVAATDRIISAVTKSRNGAGLRDLVKQEIHRVFSAVDRPIVVEHHPQVTLIVGVNGTGKTTTVGKLANLLKSQGKNPLVCAADTFRAAAVEQLEIWSKRAEVDIIRAREGADPAAVVFDAISSGKAKGRDPILVDTAGRLHTRHQPDERAGKDSTDRRARSVGRAAGSAARARRERSDRMASRRRASSCRSPASTASSSPSSMARQRVAWRWRSRTT
jgi:fused signal recognition particle receptor